MSRFRFALLAVGALTVCAAAVLTWRRREVGRSPLDSLQRLADAHRAHDRRAMEQYLDVRRVAESAVDEVIATAGHDESEGMDESMRPLLVRRLEDSVWAALTDPSPAVPGSLLDPRALIQRYQGIVDVQQRDRIARVGVRIRLEEVDSGVVAHLRMERIRGHWRVVAVEDLAPLLRASLARRLGRAYEAQMRSDLRNLVTAQEAYFADHVTYAPSLRVLGYVTTSGVSVEIVAANRDGWRAVARHQSAGTECRVAIGPALPAGDVEGQPQCSPPHAVPR